MLRIRIAQTAAVATVALAAIALAPSAALAATVGAPAPTVSLESLTWGG